ncbi:MAG TPA: TetR/AcrR family transcriptional regulator [Kofleriaceae bacterium]|nr:TetR/AcrR family transcriptional regulator [Kofleriaceae bacterium]
MGLLEEHKAERRERIARVARALVAERGYDGLTMRDLARAARVAVPTLYNLFGGKDAILVAELEASARHIASRLPLGGDSFFARGMAAFEAGMSLIEEAPEFYRAVMRMFMTSPETDGMRRRVEEGYMAIMAGNLSAAKAAGQLADWAEPAVVARHMFALYMASFLAWGMGELDLAGFRAAALSGCCHLLAGVARGPFAADVEACIRQLPPLPVRSQESPHATSRTRD